MFTANDLVLVFFLALLVTLIYPRLRSRLVRTPTLDHQLLASGCIRRAEQDWMLRRNR